MGKHTAEKIIIGKIVGHEPMRASANGNPRYLVQLDTGAALRTAADAQCNYGITNSDVQGVDLVFTLRSDEIVSYRRVSDTE